jgi:hypothetical protein
VVVHADLLRSHCVLFVAQHRVQQRGKAHDLGEHVEVTLGDVLVVQIHRFLHHRVLFVEFMGGSRYAVDVLAKVLVKVGHCLVAFLICKRYQLRIYEHAFQIINLFIDLFYFLT